MITPVEFVQRNPVGKFFFGAEIQHFHVIGSVKAGNFFAEAAVSFTVFQRDDNLMIFL